MPGKGHEPGACAPCPAPEAQASGSRRPVCHHMGRRLAGWDYRQPCIYAITMVLADRRSQALGALEVRNPLSGAWVSPDAARGIGLSPDSIEARVVPGALGRAVFAHFRRIGDFTPEIEPLRCEIMPDHLHVIVRVVRAMKRPLGNAIGAFKTGCEKLHAAAGGDGRLLAPGFVDHVILQSGQLAHEFAYLRDNPRRAATKALFPDLFKVARCLKVGFKPGACAAGAGQGEPAACAAGAGQEPLFCAHGASHEYSRAHGASHESLAQASGYFQALGNHFLLGRPLVQVQVSRRDFAYRRVAVRGGGRKIARLPDGEPEIAFSTAEYAARRESLFAAARLGAVLISPCVSDGERQIAREAMAARLPLVAMRNKGFSKLEKPAGRHFDACAAGLLLLLAPAAWPFTPGEKPMSRADATAMNRLCQWLAGDGAADINYRGLMPADIDSLALAACAAPPSNSH